MRHLFDSSIRTPLNSLLILSDSLAKNKPGNLTPEQVEKAEVIHGGGVDLLNLINDILDLSKVEAGKLDVHNEETSLADILNHLRRQFTPIANDKGLELRLDKDPAAPETIYTDGQRVEQILRNLASNAFKFTEKGSVAIRVYLPQPTVELRSGLATDQVVAISVTDTGIGIAEDKQRSIFEAFQQADGTTSRRFGGTGLGLTISRELAKLVGGEITLQSEEGKGSTFTLYLPLGGFDETTNRGGVMTEVAPSNGIATVPGQDLAEASEQAFVPDDRSTLSDNDRTVLIIEDDARFAKILVELSRERGFKCLTAGNGKSGLKMATKYSPDAILLDLGLPEVDGLTVLDTLKHDLKTRHIPVHVVSAMDERQTSLEKGALGFLLKPASPEALGHVFERFESLIQSAIRELLIVEDDPGAQKATGELLASKDINITYASNGKEALKKIRAQSFDCIVLDLGLPDMTGFDLLDQLSEDDAIALPPVVVYTGKELTKEEYTKLSKHADSVVIKGASSPERLLDDTLLFLHSAWMGRCRGL